MSLDLDTMKKGDPQRDWPEYTCRNVRVIRVKTATRTETPEGPVISVEPDDESNITYHLSGEWARNADPKPGHYLVCMASGHVGVFEEKTFAPNFVPVAPLAEVIPS